MWGCAVHTPSEAAQRHFRSAVLQSVWRQHHRKRCPEVVMTLIARGHRLDPVQALPYRRVLALRRLLMLRPELLPLVRRAWEYERVQKHGRDPVPGPVGCVRASLARLGWTWPRPEVLRTATGMELDLGEVHEGRLEHEIREAARKVEWERAAARRPFDMDGLQRGVDVEASTAVLRAKGKRKALTPLDAGYLRVLIAGATWTQDRLNRCKLEESGVCPHCTTGDLEDQQHINWRCPAWRHVRQRHPIATRHYRDDWPACLRTCGIMPADQKGAFDEEMKGSLAAGPPAGEIPPAQAAVDDPALLPAENLAGETKTVVGGRTYVVVWTDGASTNNQHRNMRRAGYGAFWGPRHSWNI
eukprot:gene19687-biopygen9550